MLINQLLIHLPITKLNTNYLIIDYFSKIQLPHNQLPIWIPITESDTNKWATNMATCCQNKTLLLFPD